MAGRRHMNSLFARLLAVIISVAAVLALVPAPAQAASWKEDWSAAGFFLWLQQEYPNDWATANDAETAYNMVKYGRGSSYSGIEQTTNLKDRDDASSLLNMYRSVLAIEQCNEIRARHGAPALKTNCQMMAASILMCNAQLSFGGGLYHTRAYSVSENLAVWHTDPFKRWYDQEKQWYDAGSRGYDVAHYENIIYSGFTISGFAYNTVDDQYSEQTFASTRDYRKSYTTREFLAELERYMSKMSDEQGMPLGTWILDEIGWWYRMYDGSYPKGTIKKIEGKTYCFADNGYMATGWIKDGSKWYYFKPGSGQMVTNQWVGDYYLGRNGVMLVNTTTPDGTKVDENGKRITEGAGAVVVVEPEPKPEPEPVRRVDEWVLSDDGWRYRYADGTYPKSQFLAIGGQTYYFDDEGLMVVGWKLLDGVWYFFKDSGAMSKGWQMVGSTWYWLDKDSGAMATGWLKDNDTWYYLKDSGAMATGWQKVKNVWYYLKGSGAMATGWQKVNGTWYWLDEKSGAMLTGWFDEGNCRYYLKDSGAMATGWLKDNDTWYYFYSGGSMARSRWIGGWYYVGDDGAMMESGVTPDGYLIVDGKWDGNDRVE